MSIEATLKKQARSILAKDNWVKSIMGFLCVLSVYSITLLVIDLATYLITDDILSKPVNIAIMVGISLVGIIGFIMLSPFYTGYIRFIAECKEQKTGDVQNIIFYFKKKRYFQTVQLNLALIIRYAILFLLCAAPITALLVLMQTMPDYETGFKIGALWAGIVGAVVFVIFSRFYVMVQYLYVSGFEYRKEKELIKASRYMVKKNLGKIMSLYISFILYWLLCFFMIPLVFVYPYFKHTSILSYSYIYELEKSNTSSPYCNTSTGYQPQTEDIQCSDESVSGTVEPQQEDNNSDMQCDNEKFEQELTPENNINAQISNDNSQENALNFDNNQQTTQNAFIPDENSDIIN